MKRRRSVEAPGVRRGRARSFAGSALRKGPRILSLKAGAPSRVASDIGHLHVGVDHPHGAVGHAVPDVHVVASSLGAVVQNEPPKPPPIAKHPIEVVQTTVSNFVTIGGFGFAFTAFNEATKRSGVSGKAKAAVPRFVFQAALAQGTSRFECSRGEPNREMINGVPAWPYSTLILCLSVCLSSPREPPDNGYTRVTHRTGGWAVAHAPGSA